MKNPRNKLISQIGMLLFFLIGLLIMTYPFYINALNHVIDQQRVAVYLKNEQKKFEQKKSELAEENKKNEAYFSPRSDPFNEEKPTDKTEAYFYKHLIGTIDIPSLSLNIPLYDETNNELLNRGATVLEGTSYPVGGEGTHSVISAHRGLPQRTLFTNLPELKRGDLFLIHVLGETLAYKVRDTHVVLPNETDILKKEVGQDLVTLVTCTPYMINSHRLLVTGYRVPYTPEIKKQQEQGDKWRNIKQWLVMIGTVVAVLLWVLLLWRHIHLYRLRQMKMTIEIMIVNQHKAVTLTLFDKKGKTPMLRHGVPYDIHLEPNDVAKFTDLPSNMYSIKWNNQPLMQVGRKKIKQDIQVVMLSPLFKSDTKNHVIYLKKVRKKKTTARR